LSVIKKKNTSIAEARKLLEEAGGELNPLQRRVLDYVVRFSKLNSENAIKLLEELKNEAGVDENTAVQIVNCLPKSPEEMRTILGRQKIISEEDLKKILGIIARHI